MQVGLRRWPTLVRDEPEGSLTHAGVYLSQFGEDVALWHYFQGVKDGFYVDVGAHHPFRYSNTYLLHRFRSWRGINIDLDERAVDELRTHRPRDLNLLAAISADEATRDLVLVELGARNTLDPELARGVERDGIVYDRRTVETVTLASILDAHLPEGQEIDLLNVDVEGLDLDVLRGNDWSRYRPRVVAVERHGLDLAAVAADEGHKLLASQGYRLMSHVVVTSIYRRTEAPVT